MLRKILPLIVILISTIICSNRAYAQGVTTSTISGMIRDEFGKPLEGATITALHVAEVIS